MPASSLRCAWWWLLITGPPSPVHTTPSSVLALARTLFQAWPLACSPLSVLLTHTHSYSDTPLVFYCPRQQVVSVLKKRFIHKFQGDRFGGALDAAAKQFSKAFDSGMLPMEFVNKMKKDGKLIMGIGHRVKSVCRFSHYLKWPYQGS